MQPAMSNEPYSNGNAVASPTISSQFAGASSLPAATSSSERSTPTTLLDERCERERERSRAAAAVERALAAVERGEQLLHAVPQRRRALLLDRHAISDHVTHRRPLAPLGCARETIPQAIS